MHDLECWNEMVEQNSFIMVTIVGIGDKIRQDLFFRKRKVLLKIDAVNPYYSLQNAEVLV